MATVLELSISISCGNATLEDSSLEASLSTVLMACAILSLSYAPRNAHLVEY
jgi:hypothetical protein